MTFTYPFTYPFYSGQGSATDVPDLWDVALNGRTYLLDIEADSFRTGLQTVPLLRTQADDSTLPGEGTINPDDLWPRSQATWHHGAGQEFLDRDDSDPYRFHASLNIDPWTIGQLKLLPTTAKRYTGSGSGQPQLLRVGTYLYALRGTAVEWSADGAQTWATSAIQAGNTPAVSGTSIASDGFNVWAALGANGVNVTTRGAASSADYNALVCTLLGYAKGRLMAANLNVLYNITSTATPTALFTHPNTDFRWTGFAEGTNNIYAAGFSGDKSLIYKTAVVADGTALAVPTVAGELPDGEIVRCIQGYLGFLIIGTETGFRVATQDANGNLTIGALVNIGQPILCFEPQKQYVWFGWSSMDSTHAGLGRMDLTTFTSPLVPAYASDINTTQSVGTIVSVVYDQTNALAFADLNGNVFVETPGVYPTDGYLTTGKLDYGLGDDKVALRLKMRHAPLTSGQKIDAYLSVDGGTFDYAGTSNAVGTTGTPTPIHLSELAGRTFELKLQPTGGVVFQRYDLQAYPAGSARGRTILVPLLLVERLVLPNDAEVSCDPLLEYQYLNSLIGASQPSTYQELGIAFSCFVEEVQFMRRDKTDNKSWWNGTALLRLKVLGD